jgi:hypothetical protein
MKPCHMAEGSETEQPSKIICKHIYANLIKDDTFYFRIKTKSWSPFTLLNYKKITYPGIFVEEK